MTTRSVVLSIAFALVAAAGHAPIAHAGAPFGLVGHWPLDESGGTVVHDALGFHDGSILGAPTFISGVAGNALVMSRASNDRVVFGDVFDFAGNSSFSLSYWIRFAGPTAIDHYPVSKHFSGVVAGWITFVGTSGGCYGAPHRASLYTSNSCGGEVTSTSDVDDGAWHHMVFVNLGGTTKSVYIDGVLEATKPATSINPTTGTQFMFGGLVSGGVPVAVFDGMIDDVQLYEVGLTCRQIAAMAAAPGTTAPNVQDLNGDGAVDGTDLAIVLGSWGPCDTDCIADLNCDDAVDGTDLAQLLGAWAP